MVNLVNVCCLTILFGLCIDSTCIKLSDKPICYSDPNVSPKRFYGSKTTYTIARQSLRNDSFKYEIPDCKPIMLYFIGRHAIRYPDGEDIIKMSQVLPQLQESIISAAQQGLTELCEKDLLAIREWKLRMNESDDNRISETGVIETKAIAKEFMDKYPSLFNIKTAKIEVGITTKVRTAQTADAFLQQIKLNQNLYKKRDKRESSEEGDDDKEDKDHNDRNEKESQILKTVRPFLYFHDTCEELLLHQGVELGKPKLVKDLRQSDLMQKLVQRVNERLGFQSNNFIDAKVLRHVIRACYFEFAIYGQSPWCAALGDEEFNILEYLDDIEDFYEDAYGRNINGKQTCPLIGDLLDKVEFSVKNNKDLKTYLHFTHAGVIKRLYPGLGLFNDLDSHSNTNLKSDEAICLNENRKWKSSLVSPFSANFAAVLYKCKKSKNDKNNSKYKLLTLVQQNPVAINGCDSALCSVDKFIDSYKTKSSNCDLYEICKI